MQLMKLVTTTLGIFLLSCAQTVAGKELNFSMSVNGMASVGTNDNVVVTFVDNRGREIYKETREGLQDRWKFHVFRTGELSNNSVNNLGHIEVRVEGDDGLVVDYAWVEARVIGEPPSNEKIAMWGVFDEEGWCLSKDPGDANIDLWSGRLVADQCKPGYAFIINPNEVIEYSGEQPTGSCTGIKACEDANFFGISRNKSCQGDYSCFRSNIERSDSNSCWGSFSCSGADGLVVDEESCHGDSSCANSTVTDVGQSSCIGSSSCFNSKDIKVGEGSCHGDSSCADLNTANVGPSSCIGKDACRLRSSRPMGLNVQEGSCVGEQACVRPGFRLTIGENSCNCKRCCGYCDPYLTVPYNSCNHDENGVPVNPDDFIDGKCKYCVRGPRKNVEDEL